MTGGIGSDLMYRCCLCRLFRPCNESCEDCLRRTTGTVVVRRCENAFV